MSTSGFDTGRFGRLLALIAFVSAVFIITSAEALEGEVFQLAVFAIGAIAVLTAIIGFLIAAGAAYDEAERNRQETDDSTPETGNTGDSVQETDDSSGIVGPYES
jgi:hypothetical protein